MGMRVFSFPLGALLVDVDVEVKGKKREGAYYLPALYSINISLLPYTPGKHHIHTPAPNPIFYLSLFHKTSVQVLPFNSSLYKYTHLSFL